MKFGLKEIAVGTVLALGCSPDKEVQSDAIPTGQQICRARLENVIGALETFQGFFRESSNEALRNERRRCLQKHGLPENYPL